VIKKIRKWTPTHQFNWSKKDAIVSFGVKLFKSTDSEHSSSGQLMCDCGGDFKQKYECQNCNEEKTIGQIRTRKDKNTEAVYTIDEKKKFMESEIANEINVISEMDINQFFINVELIGDNSLEIFNNENNYIFGLYTYLLKNQKCLLVKIGYKGNKKSAIITPSNNKLIAKFLKDSRIIRIPKQEGIEYVKSRTDTKIEKLTKNEKYDLEEKFIELKLAGKEIPIAKPKKTIKEQGEMPFFMQDLEKPIAV